jgi:MFS family permease
MLGAGSLVAALILAGTVKRPNISLLLAAATGFSLLLLLLALIHAQVVAYGVLFLIGLTAISFSATSNTLLQTSTPDRLRGRVMGMYAMLFAGTTPIGALMTGSVAKAIGTPGALIVDAIPCVAIVCYGWLARHQAVADLTGVRAHGDHETSTQRAAAPPRSPGLTASATAGEPARQ